MNFNPKCNSFANYNLLASLTFSKRSFRQFTCTINFDYLYARFLNNFPNNIVALAWVSLRL
jgi:hypothetical protein